MRQARIGWTTLILSALGFAACLDFGALSSGVSSDAGVDASSNAAVDGSVVKDSGSVDAGDAAPFADAGPTHIDISSGAAPSSGQVPSLAIDAANGKLLIATTDSSNSNKVALFRCNLDGTSCVHIDISAGAGASSGQVPSLAIDAANGKLLVATQDDSNSSKPGLFRCNLDGTSCEHLDISADAGTNTGFDPSLAIDAAHGKLLVATRDHSNFDLPALFRCNLDGTLCAHVDISAGASAESGYNPSLAIDAPDGELLVVTDSEASSDRPALFRCNLDGTSCMHLDISAGAGTGSGHFPSLATDAANGKLLVATQDDSNGSKPGLFRCNLDGTSCAYLNISAGADAGSGDLPSLAIDAANSKLLVATQDNSNGQKPALFRCNLDGTSCGYLDISGGAGANSGRSPSLAIDTTNGAWFVATDDGSNSDKPALFLVR